MVNDNYFLAKCRWKLSSTWTSDHWRIQSAVRENGELNI